MFSAAPHIERDGAAGAVVECGTCNGGSAGVLADTTSGSGRPVWLFDSDGFIVGGENFPNIFPGFDDRAPGDCELPSSPCLPEFFPGDFAGGEPGIYYLGFSLFATAPVVGPGLPLSGWDRDPFPFQTGSYDLTMTGTFMSHRGDVIPW